MFTNRAVTIQDQTQLVKDENGKLKAIKTVVQEEVVTTETIYQRLIQLGNHKAQLASEINRVDEEIKKLEDLLNDFLINKNQDK